MTLDDLRKIAENATKGPWEAFKDANEFPADFGPIYEWLIVNGDEDIILDWSNGTRREDAEFIATFNPARVLELLDRIERLRHQNSRLMAGNFTPAERADWRGEFIRADDENRHLRARLAAVEELHVPQPGLEPAYCIECDQLHPCDTTKAVRGE